MCFMGIGKKKVAPAKKAVAKKAPAKKVAKAKKVSHTAPPTTIIKKMTQTGSTVRRKPKQTKADEAIKGSLPAGRRETANPHKYHGKTIRKVTRYTEKRADRSDAGKKGLQEW